MAEKKETKQENGKEFVIPLREKCRVVPRYKKTNKAVKTIKEFLVRHMKIRDRDLKKIKLDVYLNEFLWKRGIKNPPHKIKVKAIKEGETVKVELVDIPKKIEQKKARREKIENLSSEIGKKKKAEAKPKEKKEDTEKKEDEKEKKAAVAEEGKVIEKAEAKKMKHESKKPVKSQAAQKQNLSR
jgi:large subunit ribosomal protein L31e